MRTTKADERTLMRRMLALAEAIHASVGAAVAECAQSIAEQARQTCPVASGRLRDSIGVEVLADSAGTVIAARIAADAPYAAAVELGLGGQHPQPFLLPAAEAGGKEFVATVKGFLLCQQGVR